jgi:predicted transcriptional regulator
MNPIDAFKIIDDEIAVKILIEAARHPSSALDISYRLSISLTTCQSRLSMLEENNLIHCVKMPPTQNGLNAYVYITDYHNMKILFNNFEEELEFIDTNPIASEEGQI